MTSNSGTVSYRLGGAAALLAGFLVCWVNVAVGIVGEDDPANLGFFGVVVTAAACAFVARFRAHDMAGDAGGGGRSGLAGGGDPDRALDHARRRDAGGDRNERVSDIVAEFGGAVSSQR
jgi:hypothetical protein